jgi:homocysteine S-methyltransferase
VDRSPDPLGGAEFVTDGGLETDLLFNHGLDLPEFAAFPLVEDKDGASTLMDYYDEYAAIARAAGRGLALETPTWRANPDWAERVGYDKAALDRVNRAAVELVRRVQARADVGRSLVVGVVGPRGDGYLAGEAPDPDEAADYHSVQIASFAGEGVDAVHAMTLTGPHEAVGVVRAARAAGVPVAVSFTVEVDGVLPDGTSLQDAIRKVDETDPPDWFGVNCAHPTHVAQALDGGSWRERIAAIRPNASTLTHAELDVMEELDTGDIGYLTSTLDSLRGQLPGLAIIGGCCGTDARHVAAMWGVPSGSDG